VTVHVLDTGAVLALLRSNPPRDLLDRLKQADVDAVLIPSVVMIEVEQVRQAPKRRVERILGLGDQDGLADIAAVDERLAKRAADALRSLYSNRPKCPACSDLGRPNLVDAVVMALAAKHAELDTPTSVQTQDVDDMEKLKDALCADVDVMRVS